MTDSPLAFATINSRDDLTQAIRERRMDLGMCQLELDERTGLPGGYTGNLEAVLSSPNAVNARSIGWTALPLLMGALGLELVAVRQGSLRKRLSKTERAKRGARARSDRLSPERRREIAREAARARWENQAASPTLHGRSHP